MDTKKLIKLLIPFALSCSPGASRHRSTELML